MAYCTSHFDMLHFSHGPELVPSQSLLGNIFLYIQIFYWKHIKEETYEESSQGIHPRLPQNSVFFTVNSLFTQQNVVTAFYLIRKHHFHTFPNLLSVRVMKEGRCKCICYRLLRKNLPQDVFSGFQFRVRCSISIRLVVLLRRSPSWLFLYIHILVC